MKFAAPRILKAPLRCRFSALKNASAPVRLLNVRDVSTGVRCATVEIRLAAARISDSEMGISRLQLADNPIPYPVLVPPLDRVDLNAIKLHAEVQMIAARQPRGAAQTHRLAALHHVSRLHIDAAQMAVDRLQPVAVVHHDAIAVNAEPLREYDAAVVGGENGRVFDLRQIEAQMDLLVDLLPFIDITAIVGEFRFHLRICELKKWTSPKKMVGRFRAQIR